MRPRAATVPRIRSPGQARAGQAAGRGAAKLRQCHSGRGPSPSPSRELSMTRSIGAGLPGQCTGPRLRAVIRITVVIRRLRARGSPQARPRLTTGRPGPGPRGAGMPVLSTDRRRGWARPGAGYRAAGPEPVSLKGTRFRPECTETGSGHECTIVSDRPSPGHPLSFCWAFTGFP